MDSETEPSKLEPDLERTANSAPLFSSGELEAAFRIASDPARPREERYEAFSDLVDAEVGDTSLVRARNLERESGLHQLYLKFEGGNPTGTHKDRIACAQVGDALRRGFDTVALATCGNYGAAMAFACRLAGLGCRIYIPSAYHAARREEMRSATIHMVEGDYEAAVDEARRAAESEELYDANPGGANTPLQIEAYGQIAWEIYDELRDAPAAIGLPVSNGTALAGVHRGFLRLHQRGKTSRVPRIAGGSSYRKNPIVHSFRLGLDHCRDLPPETIRESAINEPLVNWHSLDGDLALAALHTSNGWVADASDRSLRQLAASVRDQEGLAVLPAACAGLYALLDLHRRQPLPPDRYVAVLTARR